MKKNYKINFGQHVRLATIFSSFAVICGNFLLNNEYNISYEDVFIIVKVKEQIEYVKKGMIINKKTKGLEFSPETLHCINAVKEFECIEENVRKIVNKINNVIMMLEKKKKTNKKMIVEVFSFSTKIAQKFIK